MKGLLWFFKLFAVQQTQKEMQKFFWHDESTEIAKEHIKLYVDGIQKLKKRYDDEETLSYEDHMSERREINIKLGRIKKNRDD